MQLFQTTGAMASSEVNQDIKALAGALAEKHGLVRISSESSGTHLYMACPCCLERDGDRELKALHLSVNADRYCMIGRFIQQRGAYNNDRSGMCMKTQKPFSVDELLNMLPLSERGFKESAPKVLTSKNAHRLVDDGNGNMVPENPGKTIPIVALPDDHPVMEVLRDRGYDSVELWHQFRCSYCTEELPQDRDIGRFYKKMPGGFKDTPQGRLIFYTDMQGIQRGWQARILEKIVDETEHYFWHPYEQSWEMVFYRSKPEDEWIRAPMYRNDVLEWKPSKYKTATGMSRNSTLMGLDAAIAWNKAQGRDYGSSLAVICEGPLDAARMLSPAIPLLGKHLSHQQAELLVKHFKHVIMVNDNDKAGRQAKTKATTTMAGKCDFTAIELPGAYEGMDPGDLTYKQAEELLAPHKERTRG